MSKILRPLELDDAAGFDPYYKWLAINPKEQPPNYYRLLGVSLFESDPDAIANAADARMAHVKTFQIGAHSALSQRILNEIALAKVCLLNPQQRSEYDQQLRGRLDAGKPESPPCDPAPAAVVVPTSIYSLPRRKKLPDMVFGLSLLGVAAIVLAVILPVYWGRKQNDAPFAPRSTIADRPVSKPGKQKPRPESDSQSLEQFQSRAKPSAFNSASFEELEPMPDEDTEEPKYHVVQPSTIADLWPDAKPIPPRERQPQKEQLRADKPEFTVEVQRNAIYLWQKPPGMSTPARPLREPKWSPMTFPGFVRILQDGELPEFGLFNVDGKPVEPSLVALRDKAVECRFNGKSFDVVLRAPGVHVLRASVGPWTNTVKIVVRKFPLHQGMPAKDLIKQFGYPQNRGKGSTLQGSVLLEGQGVWMYARWPDIGLIVSTSPGPPHSHRVSNYVWLDNAKANKEKMIQDNPALRERLRMGEKRVNLIEAMMEVPRDWRRRLFPNEATVYVATYPNDKIQGVFTLDNAKLDGAAIALFESGYFQTLAFYKRANLNGPMKQWKENGERLLYADYKYGRKHGLLCLFQAGSPWLIQEWDKGNVQNEYLMKFSELVPKAQMNAEESEEYGKAITELALLEAKLKENEAELKRDLVLCNA